MMVFSVLVFSIITFFVSFLVGKMSEPDSGKVAFYMTLIAWGSMLFGLYVAKVSS